MYLRISPRKKIGIEIPISEASRLPWSKAEPYLFAARKPSGTPNATAKIIAPSASSTVAGKRILISSVTGRKDVMLVPRLQLHDRLVEVAPVLDVDRLVEAELVVDLRDRLRRRPLAEQPLRGPARKQADPDEDENRDPEENRKEQEQPADGEAKHLSSAGCSLLLVPYDE